jgi:hypothetical protein
VDRDKNGNKKKIQTCLTLQTFTLGSVLLWGWGGGLPNRAYESATQQTPNHETPYTANFLAKSRTKSFSLSPSLSLRPPSLTLSLTPVQGFRPLEKRVGVALPSSLRRRLFLSLSMPSDPRKYRAQHPPTCLFLI